MKGSLGQLWVVSIPMKTPFRGITHREALIFRGERYAEWSPFVEYQDVEAATWLKGAISWANDPLPEIHRDHIFTNATLPAVAPTEVAAILKDFEPFRSVKVKVAQPGEGLEQDFARIKKVSELYPNARIRLDANGGYSLNQALDLVEAITDFNIEYLEQPVKLVTELAELKLAIAGTGLKITADESIRKASDPYEVARLEAADIVMLKAQPLGGVAAALEIANSIKLDVVVSSALETSIGISQGLHLAAALPELNYDCGLATLNLLDGDIVQDSLKPVGSRLEVKVVEPDIELLEKWAASPERTKWWLDRLQRCLDVLGT